MTQSKKLHFVSAIKQPADKDGKPAKGQELFYYVNKADGKVKYQSVPMQVKPCELGTIANHIYANRNEHDLVYNKDTEGNEGVIMIIGTFKEDENHG